MRPISIIYRPSSSENHTVILLISFFQNALSAMKLASTTAFSFTSSAASRFESGRTSLGFNKLLTKRAVSQLILHPRVPVKSINDVSGGRRKYGCSIGGMRLREDIVVDSMDSLAEMRSFQVVGLRGSVFPPYFTNVLSQETNISYHIA